MLDIDTLRFLFFLFHFHFNCSCDSTTLGVGLLVKVLNSTIFGEFTIKGQ